MGTPRVVAAAACCAAAASASAAGPEQCPAGSYWGIAYCAVHPYEYTLSLSNCSTPGEECGYSTATACQGTVRWQGVDAATGACRFAEHITAGNPEYCGANNSFTLGPEVPGAYAPYTADTGAFHYTTEFGSFLLSATPAAPAPPAASLRGIMALRAGGGGWGQPRVTLDLGAVSAAGAYEFRYDAAAANGTWCVTEARVVGSVRVNGWRFALRATRPAPGSPAYDPVRCPVGASGQGFLELQRAGGGVYSATQYDAALNITGVATLVTAG